MRVARHWFVRPVPPAPDTLDAPVLPAPDTLDAPATVPAPWATSGSALTPDSKASSFKPYIP
jgi:hypothetical protein